MSHPQESTQNRASDSSHLPSGSTSRRLFLQGSTTVAAAGFASSLLSPGTVHAGGSDKLRVGLIGCGGRGRGAAEDALMGDPNTELVAVADAFADQAEAALNHFRGNENINKRVKVEQDGVFVGFNAYKELIDSGVDVVLLATSPHFRPAHVEYAVNAGKHLFVEKPIAVDVPGVKRVEKACELAKQKGLAVVSGLCWRYDHGVRATMQKVLEGEVGDIISIQSSYNAGTLWHRTPKPEWSEMENQMRNWLYYTWLSGDHIAEQAIHSLDKCGWALGDVLPDSAVGMGGRQQRTDPKFGHIFDHHSVVYDFPGGVKVFFTCRQQANTATEVAEHIMGTDGIAHVPQRLRIEDRSGKRKWSYRGKKPSMYRVEHQELFASIRDGNPINNGQYMCNSTLLSIMGRMATYTGKVITRESLLNSTEQLGPTEYAWGDVPVAPVAIPGVTTIA